jgi:hypothetical protein
MGPGPSSLLQRLELISRERPDRVLRLRGQLPLAQEPAADRQAVAEREAAVDQQAAAETEAAAEVERGSAADGAESGAALDGEAPAGQAQVWEPFELLIFRGFSSSVTHPTAYDPDQSALPPGAVLGSADLLAGPLDPSNERLLVADRAVDGFLDPAAWL